MGYNLRLLTQMMSEEKKVLKNRGVPSTQPREIPTLNNILVENEPAEEAKKKHPKKWEESHANTRSQKPEEENTLRSVLSKVQKLLKGWIRNKKYYLDLEKVVTSKQSKGWKKNWKRIEE